MAKNGFRIADAYVEIHVDNSEAKAGLHNLPNEMGPDADKAGRDVGKKVGKGLGDEVNKSSDKAGKDGGSKLAQGFQLSFLRNSPLIAAAVAGGLLAGAPIMLGAAALLFGGIGLLAASQNNTVRAGFVGLWADIKSGAQDSASSMVPVLQNAVGQISSTFRQLQPDLKATFEAAAPQMSTLVRNVDDFALRAMPGFRTAVQHSTPVMNGLGDVLQLTGTGLTNFFDIISQHAPAAGAAFTGLGTIVGNLLPILGHLMGQGAELGGHILPALGAGLGVVNTVLGFLAPVLPPVVMGIGALKIAQAAGGWISGMGAKMVEASQKGGMFAGALQKVGGGMFSLSSAAGTAGLTGVLIGVESYFTKVDDVSTKWATNLMKGGDAADKTRAQMSNFWQATKETTSGFDGFVISLLGAPAVMGATAKAIDETSKKQKEMLANMNPLERATANQNIAQNDLNKAINDYGPTSSQAASAAGRYRDASDEVRRIQEEEQRAIEGVTKAMIDQADQEDSRANSDIAYRQAKINLTLAQQSLATAQASGSATATDLSQAQLNVEKAMIKQAEAAGKLAFDALPATMTANERNAAAAVASLKELDKLRVMYGGVLPPNLEAYRQGLEMVAGQVDKNRLRTDELKAKTEQLGRTKAHPEVTVDTVPAHHALNIIDDLLHNTDRQRPKPVADLNISQAKGHYDAMMGMMWALGQQRPTPIAILHTDTYTAQAQVNAFIASNQNRYIYTKLVVQKQLATGGEVGPMTRAASGRVVGPGTGTSDSVPAIGDNGDPWRLSAHEFVVNAAVSQAQGSNMDLLNSGQATIVPTGVNPTTGTGAKNGGIRIEHLDVHLHGTFDFSDRAGVRKMVSMIRDELRDLDRSYR